MSSAPLINDFKAGKKSPDCGGGGGTGAYAGLRPPEQGLNCPRCDSQNTKFCYYNNYSLSQPRHFCRNCRRYWTKGGALRNVPVGGGCRKNKMPRSHDSSPSSSSNPPPHPPSAAPKILSQTAMGFHHQFNFLGSHASSFSKNIASSIESLCSTNHDLHWRSSITAAAATEKERCLCTGAEQKRKQSSTTMYPIHQER